MPVTQCRNANFGKRRSNATGSSGVGYTLLDVTGTIVEPRTVSGVSQLMSGTGMYQAEITFPDNYCGSILWDTGTSWSEVCYATEDYNPEDLTAIYDKVLDISGSVEQIKGMTEGRWLIDENTNKMFFYGADNTTLLAEFDLKDANGDPTVDAVFERIRVT